MGSNAVLDAQQGLLILSCHHHACRHPVGDLQCKRVSKLAKRRWAIRKILNRKDLGDDLLATPVVLVIVTLSALVPFAEVCLFAAIETYRQVLGFETLRLVYVNETLDDLPGYEADIVVV